MTWTNPSGRRKTHGEQILKRTPS